MSLAGLVDLATGRVSIACNLGWFNVPLGEIAGERFGLPIYAAMDTRMAVLGKHGGTLEASRTLSGSQSAVAWVAPCSWAAGLMVVTTALRAYSATTP